MHLVPVMWVFYISLIGVLLSVFIRGAFDGVSLIFLIIATAAFIIQAHRLYSREHQQ